MPINLFLLPSENKNNKYISLLSSSLIKESSRVNIIALKNNQLFRIIPYLISGKTRGAKNIIHFQWSTLLYGSKFLPKSIFLLIVNISLIVFVKIFFNFKIVWTVHNFYAHDYPHHFFDVIGRRTLFSVANCVAVQQQTTLLEYKNRYPKKNIEYVPHGNFIDAYGPIMERDYALRRSFGIEDGDILLLSLGAIAPYKLNEKIIDAVIATKEKPDGTGNFKVLIIGKGNNSYIETLENRELSAQDIIVKNGFVPDEDIPRYLSIADYSVFYYDKSEMTSGGIILSLSYGVPVITRSIPAAEIITNKNGLIFSSEADLVEILNRIKSTHHQYNSRGIIDDMRAFNWSDSAKKLINIYDNL